MPSRQWRKDDFVLHVNRTEDFDFELFEADGDKLVLAATDVVRFKLDTALDSSTPVLDIDSVGATANGSVVTVITVGVAGVTPAKVRVRFGQGDTSGLTPNGPYYGELLVVDDSETAPANAIKPVMEGPIKVKGTIGGDVGLS